MSFIFLDWEKAFDRIKQDKLLEVLRRVKVPCKIIAAVASLYKRPMFRVRINQVSSDAFPQARGICQGCPLSPYLVVVLMSAMFCDIHEGDSMGCVRQRLPGVSWDESFYADDTVVMGQQKKKEFEPADV